MNFVNDTSAYCYMAESKPGEAIAVVCGDTSKIPSSIKQPLGEPGRILFWNLTPCPIIVALQGKTNEDTWSFVIEPPVYGFFMNIQQSSLKGIMLSDSHRAECRQPAIS